MATAQKLNESYQNFLESKDGNKGLESLLEVVRAHVIDELSKNKRLKLILEDIAQEVCVRTWRSIAPCERPLKPFDIKSSSFSTWVSLVESSITKEFLRVEEEYDSVGDTQDLIERTEK